MKSSALIRRFGGLDGMQRRLLAEALFELTLASVVIALRPFRRSVAFGATPLVVEPPDRARADAMITAARWSVEAVAVRLPWRTVCFDMGLALQRMLRHRGIAAQLHYGIAKADGGGIEAHVWIAANDRDAMGGEEAARFASVAVFPAH